MVVPTAVVDGDEPNPAFNQPTCQKAALAKSGATIAVSKDRRFLLDGDVPLDNNHCENQIRPWALGRRNWLFIGSQLAGERAAVVMSLLQSVKLNGHNPWAYLKDILTRMPTQLNSRIEELLPHRWQPAG